MTRGILNRIETELRAAHIAPANITIMHHEGGIIGVGYITQYPILNTLMQRMGLAPHESSPETHGE